MENYTKKQHYVPRMYLRNFNNGKEDYVFEYNHHTRFIRNTNIEKICEENYLYEVRDEEGKFLLPELKNKVEKALAVVDSADASLLNTILNKVQDEKEYIILQDEERLSLLGFIIMMLIRNPVTRDTIPEALKMSIGKELKGKGEISFAWLVTMTKIDAIGSGIENSQITFLKANIEFPFITSSMPMYFVGMPIQREFYMPLSPQIGIELHIPQNALINLNRCSIRELSQEEIDEYNCRLLQREGSIISSSEFVLKRYIDFMNDFNRSAVNPYVKANLKLLESMSDEDFRMLVALLIDNEIKNGNEVYVNPYRSMLQKGYDSEKALNQMAAAIEKEVRQALLTNKRPGDEVC